MLGYDRRMAAGGRSARGDEIGPECLDEEEALDFAAGRLSGPDAARVEIHTDTCSRCRHFVALLARAQSAGTVTGEIEVRAAPASEPVDTPASTPRLSAGTTIGRFRLERPIGVGGMGVVYRAVDTELGRDVAIKLVRVAGATTAAEKARRRLLAEAQLLARLSSPFVVTLYDAGRFGEDVYVALELVEGGTLSDWLMAETRSRREITAVFAMAGRGLAAAHELGIVHRDFKLENVLVTGRGAAKVTDFGLAKQMGPPSTDSVPTAALASMSPSALTRDDAVVGTPGYLAPELLRGDSATPASDQFAFAVALHRALTDQRGGANGPSARPRIPRRLARAIRRGMHPDAARRYPSMNELLGVIESPRSRLAGAVAIVAAMSAAVVLTVVYYRASSPETEDPCLAASRRVEAVWSPERRSALRHGLARPERAGSGRPAAFVERALTDYAREWSAARLDVCEEDRAAEARSPAGLDPRVACLDRALYTLEVLTLRLAKVSGRAEHGMAGALSALPAISDCRDGAVLLAEIPAPRSKAAALASLERELSELEVKLRTGDYGNAAGQAEAAVASARKLGHRPVVAKALLLKANADIKLGKYTDETIDLLYQALWEAEAGGADQLVSRIWSALLSTQSSRRGLGPNASPQALERTMRHAKAALDRLEVRSGRVQPELELRFLQTSAQALRTLGRLDEAASSAERAVKLSRSLGGRFLFESVKAEHVLAMIEDRRGRVAEAETHYRRALELGAELLGPDNPENAMTHAALANLLMRSGRAAEALPQVDRAVALRSDKAVNDRNLGHLLRLRALVLERLGRSDQALAELARARRLRVEGFGAASFPVADIEFEIGDMYRRMGRFDEASKALAQAMATAAKTDEPPVGEIAWFRAVRAECELEAGRPRRAAPMAERALAEARSTELPPDRRGLAELVIARSLVALRRDRGRAAELARKALSALVAEDEDSIARAEKARAVLAGLGVRDARVGGRPGPARPAGPSDG